MSKNVILIMFILGLWLFFTVRKSYTGGTSAGGNSHSTSRGAF